MPLLPLAQATLADGTQRICFAYFVHGALEGADADGDSVMSREEMAALAERLGQARPSPPRPPRAACRPWPVCCVSLCAACHSVLAAHTSVASSRGAIWGRQGHGRGSLFGHSGNVALTSAIAQPARDRRRP